MVYTCEACRKESETSGASLGDVYPRIVFSRQSAVMCEPCKSRLEGWLTDKWREWFVIQRANRPGRDDAIKEGTRHLNDGQAVNPEFSLTVIEARNKILQEFVDLTASLHEAQIVDVYPGVPDEEAPAEDWRNRLKRLRTHHRQRQGCDCGATPAFPKHQPGCPLDSEYHSS